MWDKLLAIFITKLIEWFFGELEKEQDEKKRLEKAEKMGGEVASAVMGFKKKYTA